MDQLYVLGVVIWNKGKRTREEKKRGAMAPATSSYGSSSVCINACACVYNWTLVHWMTHVLGWLLERVD